MAYWPVSLGRNSPCSTTLSGNWTRTTTCWYLAYLLSSRSWIIDRVSNGWSASLCLQREIKRIEYTCICLNNCLWNIYIVGINVMHDTCIISPVFWRHIPYWFHIHVQISNTYTFFCRSTIILLMSFSLISKNSSGRSTSKSTEEM